VTKLNEDVKSGKHDSRVVDLSFFNASYPDNDGNPENPTKIIYDKNDPTGAILPILYPHLFYENMTFRINNTVFIGFTSHTFTHANREVGTMERLNDNRFRITAPAPRAITLTELQRRNIIVNSGGSRLRVVMINDENRPGSIARGQRFVYIYGNRTEAIGRFDESVLPTN
jgi:hypothetical protein